MATEDLAGAERAGDIGVHDVPPEFLGEVEGGRALDLARTVDEDVDLAEGGEGPVEEGLEGLAAADVGGEPEGAAAGCLDGVGGFLNLFGTAGGGDDIRSSFGEAEGHGEADARGAADDDGGLAGEIEERGFHCLAPEEVSGVDGVAPED